MDDNQTDQAADALLLRLLKTPYESQAAFTKRIGETGQKRVQSRESKPTSRATAGRAAGGSRRDLSDAS
jgi:hypothetical protein